MLCMTIRTRLKANTECIITYVITSKYSRNQIFFEKYKTTQSFKLLFFQNNPLAQLYISTSDCKNVGNTPGSHF
jgi:hypothetical protein